MLITSIIFVPMVGGLIIALLLREEKTIRLTALFVVLVELFLTIAALLDFNKSKVAGEMALEVYKEWIPYLNINYHIGMDGLSLPLVTLASILGVCAVLASWHVTLRVKEYFAWLLILQTAVVGVFVSLDLVMFFIFWELELIPMYFLISIWGSGRKEYSAMKFLIFTLLGSAFMLIGILAIFFSTGTFNIVELPGILGSEDLILPAGLLFWFIFFAFAVKLPVWPVHSWLPDAHTDAPTAVSVMLAGVLLKMGGYGMIRLGVGLFPGEAQEYAGFLATIAVISVLYGAVITLRQTDLKRLVAFSSISHMGYVLLGISSIAGVNGVVSEVGLTGAAMQMFTHGTITGLLFLVVGFIYERAHTRHIPDLGGLVSSMPLVGIVFVIAGLASLGLPSTSGFVGELLVFVGTYDVWTIQTALGVFGIVITSGYILWTVQRVMFGPKRDRFVEIGDAKIVDIAPMVLLVITIFGVGLYPSLLTDIFDSGIWTITEIIGGSASLP